MKYFTNKTISNTSFKDCDLSSVDFSNSLLNNCDFSSSNLSYTNFSGTTLTSCNLYEANINHANFHHAIFNNCQLDQLKHKNTANFFNMICPETGPFLAYKQCYNFRIVQLLIPADAKRSSATNNTCRCSKAKVLTIKSIDYKTSYEEAVSLVDDHFIYRVGEVVLSDSFNEDRWIDSTHGIHFYMTRDEAIDYMSP